MIVCAAAISLVNKMNNLTKKVEFTTKNEKTKQYSISNDLSVIAKGNIFADSSEKKERKNNLLFLSDISPVIDYNEIIQNLLLEDTVAVLYGESNSGKTFFAIDLALSVATGKNWNGRRVHKGGVVYFALEGGQAFQNRVAAWLKYNQVEGAGVPFAIYTEPLNLLDKERDTKKIIGAINEIGREFNYPVRLIIIDTLSRALSGGDENSSADMGNFVSNIDIIRKQTPVSILFIHHTGKDSSRGARGHSLLRSAVDTEIKISIPAGARSRIVTITKQRDLSSEQNPIYFNLINIPLGINKYNEEIFSCVSVNENQPCEAYNASIPYSSTAIFDIILENLRNLYDYGNSNEKTLGVARNKLKQIVINSIENGSQESKKRSFNRAIAKLVENNKLIIDNNYIKLPNLF